MVTEGLQGMDVDLVLAEVERNDHFNWNGDNGNGNFTAFWMPGGTAVVAKPPCAAADARAGTAYTDATRSIRS